MKKLFIIVITLVVSQISFASTLQVNDIWQPGGASTVGTLVTPENNPHSYFTVYCGGVTNGGTYYNSCYKNGSVYQVTSGKSFKIREICAYSNGAGNGFQLVSATSSIGGSGQNISLTGGVYQAGAASLFPLQSGQSGNGNFQCFHFTYEMTSQTYPGFQAGGANFYAITLIGKEE